MTNDKIKLDGQRAAIRKHIEKYKKYPVKHDKEFALKTIRNCQNQILKLKKRYPHWQDSWEDNWMP